MKTIQKFLQTGFYTALFFTLTGMDVSAQVTIEVINMQALMSKGNQPGYSVEIPQAEIKYVQYYWIKKLQEESSKFKVEEIDGELLLPHVVKSELSLDTVNIYSLLIQKDNLVLLNVFVESDSVFFKPNDDKTDLASEKKDSNIKNYIRSFAVDQYRHAVTEELEGEQKELETMQKDLEDLVKDEENMTEEISTLENDIDKKEREISDIEANIDLKNQEILTHTASMQTIVGEEEKKAAKDKQKDLEKERNKMEKERSKAKDDISSYKNKIQKNNKDIEDGKKLQEEKKEEITAQTEVVGQVQTKLNGIK